MIEARVGDAPAEQDAASWSAVDHLVRLFRLHRADEPGLVSAVCTHAVGLLPDVTDAGVILAGGRRHLEVVAATGRVPERLDTLQQETGSGPCLDAARTREVVRIDDVALDGRWPEFAQIATDCGVGSMLCVPLHVDERTFGTLSLYATRGIAPSAEPVARVLAVLATITISEFRGRADLETALRTRDLIGQATGILMAARRVTADDAFALLVDRSQRTNTKLVDIARDVVDTGTL